MIFEINFFQKEIKLFNFAGKSSQEYDIIKRKEEKGKLMELKNGPLSVFRF